VSIGERSQGFTGIDNFDCGTSRGTAEDPVTLPDIFKIFNEHPGFFVRGIDKRSGFF
jgi:hypothetical protein